MVLAAGFFWKALQKHHCCLLPYFESCLASEKGIPLPAGPQPGSPSFLGKHRKPHTHSVKKMLLKHYMQAGAFLSVKSEHSKYQVYDINF